MPSPLKDFRTKQVEPLQVDQPKFGFIIICEKFILKKIEDTIKFVRIYYPIYPVVVSCNKNFDAEQIKNIKIIDIKNNVINKGENDSSLISAGFNDAIPDWNILLTAGSKIKSKIGDKYNKFIRNEKDILYAIRDRKMYFHETSWSGIMLTKSAYREIGEIPTISGDPSFGKVIFEGEGIGLGFRFLGITGVHLLG